MKDGLKIVLFTAIGGIVMYFIQKFLKDREEMKNFMNTPINVTEDDVKAIDAVWSERKKFFDSLPF
jgi:uncharacterized membrane protein (DUF106 family)